MKETNRRRKEERINHQRWQAEYRKNVHSIQILLSEQPVKWNRLARDDEFTLVFTDGSFPTPATFRLLEQPSGLQSKTLLSEYVSGPLNLQPGDPVKILLRPFRNTVEFQALTR